MADFILARKSRNLVGSILHAVLNIALGVISVAATVMSGSWVIGVILVILSKWRVFAVRPHFWWLNIKGNLVDYIVGLSVVLLTYFAGTDWLPVHFLLMIFYVVWLTIIKPMSSTTGNLVQALLAIFLGGNLSVTATSTLDSALPVIIVFLICYAACRHILVQDSGSDNLTLLSFVYGLLGAEIAWLLHHWNIVYTFGSSGIIISQLSLILTMVAFMLFYIRASITRYDGHFKASALTIPIIFSLLVIAILIIGFSNPFFNI